MNQINVDMMAQPIRDAKVKVQEQSRKRLIQQGKQMMGQSVAVASNTSIRNGSGLELRHQYKNVAD